MMLSELGTLIGKRHKSLHSALFPLSSALLLHIEVPEVSQCRFVICSGAPLSVGCNPAFGKKYDVPIFHLYQYDRGDFDCDRVNNNPERGKGSVGKAAPYARSKYQILERYMAAGLSDVGYFRRPDPPREATQGRWFPHRRLWRQLDDHSNLCLTVRSKEIIIRAGRNIYPNEVDEVIAQA